MSLHYTDSKSPDVSITKILQALITSPMLKYCVIPLEFVTLKRLPSCNRVFLQKLTIAQLNSPPFMEPQSSPPCMQQPVTGAWSEADESSLHRRKMSLRTILILSSYAFLRLQSGVFPSCLPTKILEAIFIFRRMLHVLPITPFLIYRPNNIW